MRLTGKYRKRREIVGREVAGESFLIPICGTPVDMENVFVLNPLADFIWQRMDGERTLEEVVIEVVAEFDVTPAQAGADVDEFVEDLLKNNLVEALT